MSALDTRGGWELKMMLSIMNTGVYKTTAENTCFAILLDHGKI